MTVSGTVGWGFESLQGHKKNPIRDERIGFLILFALRIHSDKGIKFKTIKGATVWVLCLG
jgi:hypothetical protein